MKATKDQIKTIGRLKRRSDFLAVQAQQKKWIAKTMVVQAGRASPGQVRFGITVTKKTSPSSVQRNRIRRRLRSAAMDVLPGMGIQPGTDLVLIGRADAADIPYDTLTRDLGWCIRRLDLIVGAGQEPGGDTP